MGFEINYRVTYACDTADDLDLAWGDGAIAYTKDNNKKFILQGGAWVERPTLNAGFVPHTATPSGRFLSDNMTWVSIPGGGDMLKSDNLAGLADYTVARTNLQLGNVNNTSDANKPVSAAQQAALDLKSNTSHNHDALYSALGHTHVKSDIGLGNVDNTSDAAKPVSTAQQTALNLKANLSGAAFTGAITSNGGGVGYATGAGGAVTQITSRTTAVTLNKLCGNITLFSAAQAAQAIVAFTLTNSFIAAGDMVLVQHISATNAGAWSFSVVAAAGSCIIYIRNVSAVSITEATPLRFTVIKGVTA